MAATQPYKRTAIFDENSLPAALRREHATKPGVWGIIRVLEGQLRLRFYDGAEVEILDEGRPGLLHPERTHSVQPQGRMRVQIEFYEQRPEL